MAGASGASSATPDVNGDGGPSDSAGRNRKVAFVTGITGQDGGYLAEILIAKGYSVHGLVRNPSSAPNSVVWELARAGRVVLHYGDLTDSAAIFQTVRDIRPTRIFNLAAQSHVKLSFDQAEYTAQVDAVGTLRLLEAIRACGLTRITRFYQASTSELYGKAQVVPQDEKTPFFPRSPYAVAKLYAYFLCINYRDAYNMYAVNGILFNHESPRRGDNFVTRKITRAVARIHLGLQDNVYLGNLAARRDWGHARDYVEAMYLMLEQDPGHPEDIVVATGKTHSVREFVQTAFTVIGVRIQWLGEGVDETGVDDLGHVRVRVDPSFYRPIEVDQTVGNPARAKEVLGWESRTTFEQLVEEMVRADLCIAQVELDHLTAVKHKANVGQSAGGAVPGAQ